MIDDMWILYVLLALIFTGGVILFFYLLDWISKLQETKKAVKKKK